MLCFFLNFVMDFRVAPQKDCVHLNVSPDHRALWPLSPALMDGYHLNSSRQKYSWLYLYFLSCYGDGILFFSVFINWISFWWIISSFPWCLCLKDFFCGLYEGLASIKMLALCSNGFTVLRSRNSQKSSSPFSVPQSRFSADGLVKAPQQAVFREWNLQAFVWRYL